MICHLHLCRSAADLCILQQSKRSTDQSDGILSGNQYSVCGRINKEAQETKAGTTAKDETDRKR
mgnify:CR=1 FL=1